MQPRIEYATTADGVNIAYTTMGEGIPLVNPPPALPWSHIQEEMEIEEWAHYYQHLGEMFRVVRYDNRGSGLSSKTFPVRSTSSLTSSTSKPLSIAWVSSGSRCTGSTSTPRFRSPMRRNIRSGCLT